MLTRSKIFTTALIFKSMLRKRFSARKWAGIALLAVAGAVNALGNLAYAPSPPSKNHARATMPTGTLPRCAACC